LQLERKKAAEQNGTEPEEDPRTIPDDRGNYAIMHAIARGNNSMAALLDACGSPPPRCCVRARHVAVKLETLLSSNCFFLNACR
jgi:hypothetical protein